MKDVKCWKRTMAGYASRLLVDGIGYRITNQWFDETSDAPDENFHKPCTLTELINEHAGNPYIVARICELTDYSVTPPPADAPDPNSPYLLVQGDHQLMLELEDDADPYLVAEAVAYFTGERVEVYSTEKIAVFNAEGELE